MEFGAEFHGGALTEFLFELYLVYQYNSAAQFPYLTFIYNTYRVYAKFGFIKI